MKVILKPRKNITIQGCSVGGVSNCCAGSIISET